MRFATVVAICRMIKIEHSIFALPFAYAGAFLAQRGTPSFMNLLMLTIAMIAVRSFSMAFNRLVDLPYDRKNPRTAQRPLVTGEISVEQTKLFCVATALLFIVSCAALNALCFQLSIPALLFAAAYSYTKRYTWLCHFWLGATLGLAPLAGWLGVTPQLHITPLLCFWGVTFWVAGFDILYSCQDIQFDKQHSLYSIPQHFGLETAFVISAFCHALTCIFLLLTGWSAALSFWWYILWTVMSAILYWEHQCVSPYDLRRVNMAFFTLNGGISIIIFVAVLLGLAG